MKISVTFDSPKEKVKKPKYVYPYEKECRALLGRYFISKRGIYYVFGVKRDTIDYVRQWICQTSYIEWSSHIEEKMLDDGNPSGGWYLYPHYEFDKLTEVTKDEYIKIRKVIDMARAALNSIADNAIKAKQIEE